MSFESSDNYFSLSIKFKTCNKWEELDLYRELKSVAHAERLLLSMDGQEAVARFKKGRNVVFLCGNDQLKKQMAPKGNCTSFAKGVEYMRTHGVLPKIVAEINQPMLSEAVRVFEGVVTEISICQE